VLLYASSVALYALSPLLPMVVVVTYAPSWLEVLCNLASSVVPYALSPTLSSMAPHALVVMYALKLL
jgi:hypothetical protein